mgnify:CR=1 FL=1
MMRAIVLSCLLLSACASVRVGPEVVGSNNLGYDSPYASGMIETGGKYHAVIMRHDVSFLSGNKHGLSGGYGVRSSILFGRSIGRVDLLAGAAYFYQHQDEWQKGRLAPRVLASFNSGNDRYSAYADLQRDSQTRFAVGLEQLLCNRFCLRLSEEFVALRNGDDGTRVSVGVLFPIWRDD